MAGRNQPLVLVVDAKIDSFKQGAAAVERTLDELAKSGGDFAQVFQKQFEAIGNVSEVAMNNAAKNIRSEIARIRREAEQAAKLGADFNPAGGFDSQGQQRLADNFTANAARARQLADAYRKVAAENEDMRLSAEAAANTFTVQAATFARDAEAASRNADMLHKVEQAMGVTATATDEAGRQVAGTTGAMRAGFQQAGFQVSDFIVQVSGGTSAIRAASQQAPQLVQALALMGGEVEGGSSRFAKFAGILNGPWGAAITVGVSLLGLLATGLLDTEEAAEEAEKTSYDFSKSLDFMVLKADAAADAMRQLVTETERLIKVTGDTDLAVARNAEAGLIAQQKRVGLAQQKVDDLKAGAAASPAGLSVYLLEIGQARKDLETERKALADARVAVSQARLGLSQRAVAESRDPDQAPINRVGEQIADLNAKRAASQDIEILDPRIRNFELAKLRRGGGVYISEAEYRAELSRLEGLKKAAEKAQSERDRKPSTRGRGDENALGGTIALLHELFPGVRITSTTGGKHKKGSDHYVGRGIDFVPAGGINSIPTDEVLQIIEDAGIKVRRNARGTKQFFGPGRAAEKPGDHDDHFHLGFEGSPSPDKARQLAQRREEQARRDREALEGALLASKEEQVRLARLGVSNAAKLAELDIAAIDAALERKLAQNAKLELDHADLDALDRANAETEKRAVAERLRAEVAERALEEERRQIGVAAQLAELEGQLATTTRDKHSVAKKLLELRYQDEKKAAEQQFAKDGNLEAYLDNLGLAQKSRDVDATKLGEQFRGPTADYAARLKDLTGDMDEAFDGIAARGLQSLEDGLVGIISGTEDVASAFKRMAASILADLARIAVQKLILSAFGIGFKGGDVPAAATGHIPAFAGGIISGPGTGTSDSILAFHEGMGLIRVSNGESIITAEGTRKHRRLLKAINDNSLPAFASGMVADVAYPAIPSAQSLRAGGAPPVHYFDLRGSVVLEELYRSMHQISAAHAGRAAAAAPSMALEELAQQNAQRIPV